MQKMEKKVQLEHEGYFLANSAVEDGVVEKSFLPDGAMKRLIQR